MITTFSEFYNPLQYGEPANVRSVSYFSPSLFTIVGVICEKYYKEKDISTSPIYN